MIVIDQALVKAPGFPRNQEWWRRFTPGWAAVTVREDGTVTMEPSGLDMRYTRERGVWWEPGYEPGSAAWRRTERSLTRWVTSMPRIAVAVTELAGQPGGRPR